MIERILLAVDDSPEAMAAARAAIELAGALQARLRVIHVSANHLLDAALSEASELPAPEVRRERSALAMLAHVRQLAAIAGVESDSKLRAGDVGPAVLDAAREWPADLVVVGRTSHGLPGEVYVGVRARHILEFAEQPVLVVPPARR